MRERNVKKIHEFYEVLVFKLDATVRFTFDKLDVVQNELAMVDENWCKWTFVEFLDALEKWAIHNPISNGPKSKSSISVEISREHFLPNTKKPEASRGQARGRVFIVVTNNIRQLTVITSKASKKGRKNLLISAWASIAQGSNTEAVIVRAEILAEFAMESTTLRYATRRREPVMTANLIGDSSVNHPVVVINMGEYKFRAMLTVALAIHMFRQQRLS